MGPYQPRALNSVPRLIFTAEQVRSIRQGKMWAVLVPVTERVRKGSLRVLRRRGEEDDGAPGVVEEVFDQRPDGERIPVLFTVLSVTNLGLHEVTLAHARACGHRSSDELKTAWLGEHPRTRSARLVSFQLGDLRDVPRLIAAGWPDYTSDPSRAMQGEPEAVARSYGTVLAMHAEQRYQKVRADMARDAAQSTMAERLAAIQSGTVLGVWN